MFGGYFLTLRGLPPLIICTLFITAFALTTLWVAYFVRTEEQLEKSDSQSNWKEFFKYLTDQEFCIQPTNYININNITIKPAQNDNYTDVISVNIPASLNLATLPLNTTYVQGLIIITGCKTECATSTPLDQSLTVSFTIPNYDYVNNYGNKNESVSQNICVTIMGPKSLLPTVNDFSSTCTNGEDLGVANSYAFLKTRLSPPALGVRVDEPVWCMDGFLARILYKLSNNEVVLSLSDRSIINLHLMHTSYCLFVMAVTLICYAVIRGRPKGKTILSVTVDKIPLEP